ncbi:MAG: C4-dicarboxylate transporter DctA [Sphingomonas sp.]|nr:C4-dicarboxylate transporter DctA [Sphingomonas sp.]
MVAAVLGVALGHFAPDTGAALRPLGELFIKLVRMMIAPIVFVTVVTGIAGLGNLREAGRLGLKAILYFELVSTLALVIGLIVGNLVQPGHGLNIDPRSLDGNAVASFVRAGEQMSSVGSLFHIVPDSLLGALASGEILQVLLVAILLGAVLAGSGQGDGAIVRLLEEAGKALFGMIGAIMYLAPVGAFGAMAFTVGKYGVGALQQLGMLIVCFYATALIFIVGVLGLIARASGFSLWRLLVYLKDEIVLVLGTSTSESALPRLMEKLERLGVAPPVVRLVVPTGYSFNLDGIAIYLTMASLFIAQALNVPLSIGEQIGLLLVLLLTSKGAAAVTGGGFITLAATLSSTHTLPVAGLALLLGIDRFMSEARAITNMIGNAVACLAVARWEGAVDQQRMRSMLHGGDPDASTR